MDMNEFKIASLAFLCVKLGADRSNVAALAFVSREDVDRWIAYFEGFSHA